MRQRMDDQTRPGERGVMIDPGWAGTALMGLTSATAIGAVWSLVSSRAYERAVRLRELEMKREIASLRAEVAKLRQGTPQDAPGGSGWTTRGQTTPFPPPPQAPGGPNGLQGYPSEGPGPRGPQNPVPGGPA